MKKLNSLSKVNHKHTKDNQAQNTTKITGRYEFKKAISSKPGDTSKTLRKVCFPHSMIELPLPYPIGLVEFFSWLKIFPIRNC